MLKSQSFYRAGRNAGSAFDAAITLVNCLAIFHFKYFYRAGADAGATSNTGVSVNLNSHVDLLDFGSLITFKTLSIIINKSSEVKN